MEDISDGQRPGTSDEKVFHVPASISSMVRKLLLRTLA